MLIKTIPVGQLEENCYVVTNEATLESVVIDPGDEANTILDYLESNKLKCVAIMLTHGHFDHVGAVDAVAEETDATVYMNELDDAKRHQNNHSSYTLRDGGIYYSDPRPHPRRRDHSGRGLPLHRGYALQGKLRQDRS